MYLPLPQLSTATPTNINWLRVGLQRLFPSWVNHMRRPSDHRWWWWLKCLALSVGTVDADRHWEDIANVDIPYILIPGFSLHDQRWQLCPVRSNNWSLITRFRWCCPCLHKQTKIKAMSRPTGLGIPRIELSESCHPPNVGVLLIFHLSVFSACLRNHFTHIRPLTA